MWWIIGIAGLFIALTLLVFVWAVLRADRMLAEELEEEAQRTVENCEYRLILDQ